MRVLGRRSHKHHQSVLNRMEQGILLGFGEAVNLVDEQEGPPAVLAQTPRRPLQGTAHVTHSRSHSREFVKGHIHATRHKTSNCGLSGSRWPVKHHRSHMTRPQRSRQRPFRPQEVLLPHDLVEASGAHAGGERGLLGQRIDHPLGEELRSFHSFILATPEPTSPFASCGPNHDSPGVERRRRLR
ncbi:MAG: hypothetical protein BWY79_01907 [Actinobacteria bacterium ADurb.Bin444]|nr:MAG: hypothetical protein BWY79_01907 [Actinobacteria bacterium ADurb.Bin444]